MRGQRIVLASALVTGCGEAGWSVADSGGSSAGEGGEDSGGAGSGGANQGDEGGSGSGGSGGGGSDAGDEDGSGGLLGDPQAGYEPVAAALGIEVVHQLSDNYFSATGQAWADVDGDGLLDLVLTNYEAPNHGFLGGPAGSFAPAPWSADIGLSDRPNTGAVFADYDRDGWPDLYLLAEGPNVLLRNLEGAGFEDVSALAGVADAGPGMTAAWADYDGDGWLDLYVANNNLTQPDRLYRNLGDGSFEEVSDLLAIDLRLRLGLTVSWFDYDNDGDVDLYVGNDKHKGNVLWRNDGPGCGGWCFTDVSASSGAGIELYSMGFAIGDYDNDGDQDVFITNIGAMALLQNQTAQGQPVFVEVAAEAGALIDDQGWGDYGWGTQFLDYDNDGWLDLYVAIGKTGAGPSKPNVLLRNLGDGSFVEVDDVGGAADPGRSYGLATADYDDDGWVDLLVGNSGGPYELFHNLGGGHHWLTIELRADDPAAPINREAIGSRVIIHDDQGRSHLREVIAGTSYAAGSSLRLHVGLGDAMPVSAEVRWSDGTQTVLDEPPSDTRWVIQY